jgi:hypothetical protein
VAKADPNMPKAFPRSAVALTTLVMLVMTLEEHRNEYSDYAKRCAAPTELNYGANVAPNRKVVVRVAARNKLRGICVRGALPHFQLRLHHW